VDGGAHVSRCVDGVGIVADGSANGSVGADGVGTVVDRGAAHARARAFAAADVASGFACLPDRSPPA
jgi:hypothetical protein